MGSLVALLSGFVLADISGMVARAKRNAVLMAISLVLFLTAYLFLLIAGYIALAHHYGPITSALIIAGALIAVAIILLIIMAGMSAREKRYAAERRSRSQLPTSMAVATSVKFFQKKPLVAASIAMAVGAILGLSRGGKRHD